MIRVKFEWDDAQDYLEYDIESGKSYQARRNESCNVHFSIRVGWGSPLAKTLSNVDGVDSIFFTDRTIDYNTNERVGAYKGLMFRSQMFERSEVEENIKKELENWQSDSVRKSDLN